MVTLGLELTSRVVKNEIGETRQSQEVNGISLKVPVSRISKRFNAT